MGPGCFHPRNSTPRLQQRAPHEASMGPGCFHPRNKIVSGVYQRVVRASMGPGCFHPRNSTPRLQQRAPHEASMGPGCFHPRNKIVSGVYQRVVRASMGPGCFHPRNDEPRPGIGLSRLQWGRDVSIPEMPRWLKKRGLFSSFNGAGMFPSQKYSITFVFEKQ